MSDEGAAKSEMEEGSGSVGSNLQQADSDADADADADGDDSTHQSRLNENTSNVAVDFSQLSGSDGGPRIKGSASRQKGRPRLTVASASSATTAAAVRTTKDEDTDSDADGDARNNLYWYEKGCFVCLWYGNEYVMPEDIVEVLPFFQDTKSEEVLVQRSDLTKLEHEHCDKISDDIFRVFCSAILDFPEWDDNSRLSYEWPPSVIDLVTDIENFNLWYAGINDLGLGPEMFSGSLKKLLLYSLCADQCGILKDSDALLIKARSALDSVLHLYDIVVQTEDINEISFRRTSSRVGLSFQATIFDAQIEEVPSTSNLNYSFAAADGKTPNLDDILQKVLAMNLLVLPGNLVHVQRYQAGLGPSSKCLVTKVVMPGCTDEKSLADIVRDIFSESSSVSLSDIEALNKKVIITVYDGTQSCTVDGSNIKILNGKFNEESILEILCECDYDLSLCAPKVLEMYTNYLKTPTEDMWSKDEVDAFYTALLSKRENIVKFYQTFRKILKRTPKIKSLKTFFGFYETLFPEKVAAVSFSALSSSNLGKIISSSISRSEQISRDDRYDDFVASVDHGSLISNAISNRWPSALPMVKHNIYWLKPSANPCLCLGLDQTSLRNSGEPMLRIIPICTEMCYHETKVFLVNLESFSLKDHEGLCQDSRAIDFAKALMMFCEWELQNRPNCVWYSYPSFVKDFLKHQPTWTTWRSRAERASRGQKDGRDIVYFNALKDELQLRPFDNRDQGVDFPWDDTAVEVIEEDESVSSDNDDSSEVISVFGREKSSKSPQARTKVSSSEKKENDEAGSSGSEESRSQASKESVGKKRQEKKEMELQTKLAAKLAKEIKLKEKEDAIRKKEIERRKELLDSLSSRSMYWISKAKLPAICINHARNYDGELPTWKLSVKPICCSTYHYSFDIDRQNIEILTENHLRECDDERTSDFAFVLMRFFDEYKESYSIDVSNLAKDMDNCLDKVFVWPAYVIDLMEQYREWSVWRKTAEREALRKRETRRAIYLQTLLCEFKRIEESFATDITASSTFASVADIYSVLRSKRSREDDDDDDHMRSKKDNGQQDNISNDVIDVVCDL